MNREKNLKSRATFLLGTLVLAGLLTLNGVSGVVLAETFTNTAPITIPLGGASSPYPSDINVSGMPEDIVSVTVSLHNLSHAWPNDMDILLVGPTGVTVMLMSDAGGGGPGVTDINLTFEDGAPNLVDLPFISGTYSPTNLGTSDTFDPPAPAGPYGNNLAALAGANPNGTWSLYIMDDVGADGGLIADGWSITFPVFPMTYQGRLLDGNVAADGDFDIEFKLYEFPVGGIQVWPSQVKEDVPVEEGHFTAKLFFGKEVLAGQRLWLEICVRPGASVDPSAFVVLSPRQELTATPMACLALKGSYVGLAPVDVDNMRDTIGLNPATSPGDLMTWDGNNWVAQQPVVQNFNFDNMQPWQGVHFIISLQGFMPTANSADPFMGEIVLFGGNFAPNGWALCDGQILPIASYPDLFSILGTIYGGDGSVTFALPDLRGRVAVHPGSGPGLTPRSLGEKSGIERHVVP